MAHVVHGHVVGRPGAAVLAVDGKARRVGVAHQVVQHGARGGGGRYLGVDGHAESPGHAHGLDHLGHGFLDGILGLVGGGAGQRHARGHPANGGDELVDLVPHQQTAVAGLGALAVLDLDGAGVFLHLRDGMQDFVPPEVAGGNLQDDVLEEARAQQARRAAALAGAHAHGHAQFLVQVGNAHLQAFPHVGGQRAERHGADDQRVDFAHRGHPAVFLEGLQALFGRQHTAQQSAQFELVPPGVQRGVGEHGNADELDLVQQAVRRIAAAATGTGMAPPVVVEAQRGALVQAHGADGVVGTDHGAHGAADAGVGRVGALADAVEHRIGVLRLLHEAGGGFHHALPVHGKLDGAHRAHGGTPPAQGAGVLVPLDLPGQVLHAQR